MHKKHIAGLALAAAGGAVGVAVASASCAATTVNPAVRTFQQAQKVDVVCLQVNDPNGNPLPSVSPLPQQECAAVPANVTGSTLPNHLFALVTQTTRGELAVVDLTAGAVVDEDRSTPGINFIPVGANPTDVAVTPDAALSFVSSADPVKPAIYGIDNTRILGDYVGAKAGAPLRLTDLPSCALPQAPQALAIAALAPGGEGGAGPEAGSAGASGGAAYAVVALLRASAEASAKLVAIDPSSFVRQLAGHDGGQTTGSLPPCAILGATQLSSALPPSFVAGRPWSDGVPYADAGGLSVGEPAVCPSTGADGGDAGAGSIPNGSTGPVTNSVALDSGSPDGGFPLSFGPLDGPHPTSMALRDDLPILYVGDSSLPLIHIIDLSDPTNPQELPPLVATSLEQPTRLVTIRGLAVSPPTRDYKRYLYAIDTNDGTLMVFDVSVAKPTAPATPMVRPHPELNPFAPIDRISFSAPVATVAFVQHDWPLVPPNAPGGDQVHAYQGLLCNPNPNAHPDGGTFDDLGAFYRVDQAGTIQPQATVQNFPSRLRGIFAFATLSNGNIVTIDVDDWDAPCRRPDPMAIGGPGMLPGGMTGVLALPQPEAGVGDLDPYHAPFAFQPSSQTQPVTQEVYFPVFQPNRMRSNFLLRNDPTSGNHVPSSLGTPQLFDLSGVPVSAAGTRGANKPLMLPTPLATGFIDPTYIQNPTAADPSTFTSNMPALENWVAQADAGPDSGSPLLPSASTASTPGVRIALDDPTVQTDQDWTVTYEGVLPNTSGIVVDIASTPGSPVEYAALTLTSNGTGFCGRGIEDWSIGQQRANAAVAAMASAGLPSRVEALGFTDNGGPPPGDAGAGTAADGGQAGNTGAGPTTPPPADLPQWTADYVEITDDLLPSDDAYWGLPSTLPQQDCWHGKLADDPSFTGSASPHAADRFIACQQSFGAAVDADTHLARDFPILQAFDDHLVVGRFAWPVTDMSTCSALLEQTTNRTVVGPDTTNPPYLRFASCCFHHQAAVKIRAGGEWVTVGQNGFGLLHHVVVDPSTNACVLSCDPRRALLNARSFDVPWATLNGSTCQPVSNLAPFDRGSPLEMRNPFFSFVMWSGCGATSGMCGEHTLSTRDLTWKFSIRGGFTPLTVSLAGNTTATVSPQSMRFISSLGQLAVVDGAQQGLVLIDLNTMAFAHNPYF